MKFIKLSLITSLLLSVSLLAEDTTNVVKDSSLLSQVEVSANVALTSNYVWRGMTQSDNSPAVQGGFDLGLNGFYIGTWASNIDFNSDASVEIDVYGGYANEIAGITYDINYCQYMYPSETDELNFGEASITLGYDFKLASVSAKYYWGVDTNDVSNDSENGWKPEDGFEVGVSVPLPMDITADATYGDYDEMGQYYSVSVSKSFNQFDLSVAYTGMDFDSNTGGHDGDGSENHLVVTLGASF